MGIFDFFKKKKVNLEYPDRFIMITLTSYAIEEGIEDDANKLIVFYDYDEYGNRISETYPYTAERLSVLVEQYKVPVFDKTDKEIKLPIWASINPSELVFVEKK